MKILLIPGLAASSCLAHTISMSMGQLEIDGAHAKYEIRMPLYELQHVPHPEAALPDAIILDGATRTSTSCAKEDSRYICRSDYEFPSPPSSVDVTCRLAQITVPNHVHVLQARNGSKVDQAVFEAPLDKVTLRFRPVGPLESAVRARPAMLLAAAMALLALAVLGSGWIGGACCLVAFLLTARVPVLFTPRFAESAVAITAAYCALEGAWLTGQRYRWISAFVLGAAMGLYTAVLLPDAAARLAAGTVVLGAGATAGIVLNRYLKKTKWLGFALTGCALAWFATIVI